jgi:hypothetical protein
MVCCQTMTILTLALPLNGISGPTGGRSEDGHLQKKIPAFLPGPLAGG